MAVCEANTKPCLLQVNKVKSRHRVLRELPAPGPVQWMGLLSERLYVGYQSGFMRYRYSMFLSVSKCTTGVFNSSQLYDLLFGMTSAVSMVTCHPSVSSTMRTTPWLLSHIRIWVPYVPWRFPAKSCFCALVPSGCMWTHRVAGHGSRSSCGRLCPTPPVSAGMMKAKL